VLAVTPGNFFDGRLATAAAIDAPHRVQQENEESPQRDELEAPLGELVVSGRRQMAARTDGGGTLARSYTDLDAGVVGFEAGAVVNKSPEVVAAV
jgi:hypothetical protein